MTSKGSSKPSIEVSATTIYTKTEIEKIAESLNIDGINAKIENQSLNIDGIYAEMKNQSLNINTKIEKNSLNIDGITAEMEKENAIMKAEINELKQENQEQQSKIADLSHTGSWCASDVDRRVNTSAVITYDSLFFNDSNMNSVALNEGTGEKCIHILLQIDFYKFQIFA